MGVVYLARSPGGRRVAIKVIRSELARDQEFRARFAQEVAAVRKVSGLYTVDVIDALLDGPRLYLVTAFIDGPTLAAFISANGCMPLPAVCSLAAALAEGLRAIHAQGIVHRDLKPGNVMLPAEGPRLIDFGIAQALENSFHTSTGIVLGTPSFMSPEQANGDEVGPPSDIFSLGALLAFAVSGRPPFGEGKPLAILHRVGTRPADTSGVPAEIRPLIDRCLVKDPALRPTAADLLTELSGAGVWNGPGQSLGDRPAELGQARQAVGLGASGPGATAVSEPAKSPRDIARELRAAELRAVRPADTKPDNAELLASLRAHQAGQGHRRRDARQADADPDSMYGDSPFEVRVPKRTWAQRTEAQERASKAREEAERRYGGLEEICAAPEYARRLARLAAETAGDGVGPSGWASSTWPAGVSMADIEAVRSGLVIPNRRLLEAFIVACGVPPEYRKPWHDALDRVNLATGGVIELRVRAIELARAFDREVKADRRRQSAGSLTWAVAKVRDKYRDPDGLNRAGVIGQLRRRSASLWDGLEEVSHVTEALDLSYHGTISRYWQSMDGGDNYLIYNGSGWSVEVVKALTAIQVDASGVDLRDLNIPERDAVIGVIWTTYTKWPDSIPDAIPPRSQTIRAGVFQVI